MSFDLQTRLKASRDLFEAGQVELARSAASEVLKDALAQADPTMQGLALMALAQYDRVVGRFRRAIDTAQRAVRLFQLNGDIAGEASALSLVAHSSSILGRDEESVEAALLGVKLCDMLPPGPRQVVAHNYLGVAYLWSRSFANAESSLREAERLALLYAPESNVLLPRTNLAWLEAMRLFQERYFTGVLPNTDTLRQRLATCAELFESDVPFVGLPGVRAVLQRFGRLTWALYLCWHGELEAAHKELVAAQDRSKPGQYAQVADVIVHWVGAELRWAERDLQGAQYEATLLTARAGGAEFKQMAYVGHLLLTQILDSQRQYALALAEERAHRRRELRVRADILDSRHRVVQTQLDIRTSERAPSPATRPALPGTRAPVVRGLTDGDCQSPSLRTATAVFLGRRARAAASGLCGAHRPRRVQAHQRHLLPCRGRRRAEVRGPGHQGRGTRIGLAGPIWRRRVRHPVSSHDHRPGPASVRAHPGGCRRPAVGTVVARTSSECEHRCLAGAGRRYRGVIDSTQRRRHVWSQDEGLSVAAP